MESGPSQGCKPPAPGREGLQSALWQGHVAETQNHAAILWLETVSPGQCQ